MNPGSSFITWRLRRGSGACRSWLRMVLRCGWLGVEGFGDFMIWFQVSGRVHHGVLARCWHLAAGVKLLMFDIGWQLGLPAQVPEFVCGSRPIEKQRFV